MDTKKKFFSGSYLEKMFRYQRNTSSEPHCGVAAKTLVKLKMAAFMEPIKPMYLLKNKCFITNGLEIRLLMRLKRMAYHVSTDHAQKFIWKKLS